jgi:hypothetical protein
MKRSVLIIIALAVCAMLNLHLQAGQVAVFQPGYWFNYPAETADSKVDGIKLGLPICSGYGSVEGMELSLFCSATDKISGLQWAFIGVTACKELNGTQLGLLNAVAGDAKGGQIGMINIAGRLAGIQLGIVNSVKHGLQFGLININEDGWLPVCILFNFSVK